MKDPGILQNGGTWLLATMKSGKYKSKTNNKKNKSVLDSVITIETLLDSKSFACCTTRT